MACKPQTSLLLSVRYGTRGGRNKPGKVPKRHPGKRNKQDPDHADTRGQKAEVANLRTRAGAHAQSEKRLPTHGTTQTVSADTSDLDNSVQQAQSPPETRGRQTATSRDRNPAQAQSYVTKTLSSGHKHKAQAPHDAPVTTKSAVSKSCSPETGSQTPMRATKPGCPRGRDMPQHTITTAHSPRGGGSCNIS